MRFTARKRPLGLVSMISRVRANLPPEHRPALVICGDGPLLRPLRAAVAASSLRDWVELPGRLSAPELAGVYRASSVYVAPARHEAFGIAALEAAAAGLPVMGYAGSGVRDIVERSGIDGLLAESDRDMFQVLVSLFSEPERLLDMTADLPAHSLCGHRWPHVTDVSIALYQRAIAGRQPAAGSPWAAENGTRRHTGARYSTPG